MRSRVVKRLLRKLTVLRLPTRGFARIHSLLKAAIAQWLRHDRLRVYIAHDALALCRIRGRFKPTVIQKAVLSVPTPADPDAGLPSMLAALTRWLGEQPGAGCIEWVVGSGLVRYLLLPWDERLASDDFCLALAKALLAQQCSPSDPLLTSAEVRFGSLTHGRPRLAAVIGRDIVRTLASFADHQSARTTTISPALALVWDQFIARFRKSTGVLVVVEGARLQRITYERGVILDLTTRPYRKIVGHFDAANTNFTFASAEIDALAGEVLRPCCMAPGDDERLAFVLVGVR